MQVFQPKLVARCVACSRLRTPREVDGIANPLERWAQVRDLLIEREDVVQRIEG
jgi:hypothetical protein